MMNIFKDGKNAKLRQLIENNAGANYKLVDTYIASNPRWFKGYIEYRKSLGLVYASRNNIIWEIIDMLDNDGDEFEA